MGDWLPRLEVLRRKGDPGVVVTVTRCTGSTPREPGAKMLVQANGDTSGTIGGGNLEWLAIEEARKILAEGKSARSERFPLGSKTGQCCGGIVELFFEPFNTGPLLYVFGAGHVGRAVCCVMRGTPFAVHLVDDRPEWIGSSELPVEAIRHAMEWDEFARDAIWDESRTHALVMTFRHDLDLQIIEALSEKPFRYLGLIGSRSKAARFRQRMEARGTARARLARVRCPIGIDIGGKTPQEVAISVASELLSLHYKGGSAVGATLADAGAVNRLSFLSHAPAG